MTMLDQASPSAETPLLDVKDLTQRYTLPRESMFKPAGQVDLCEAGDGAGTAVIGVGVADGP